MDRWAGPCPSCVVFPMSATQPTSCFPTLAYYQRPLFCPPHPPPFPLLLAEETLAAAEGLRDEPPTSFLDRVLDNEINIAVARTRNAYDRMLFREALKTGWWVDGSKMLCV